MKKIIIYCLFIAGCHQPMQEKNTKISTADSIIANSTRTLKAADSVGKSSDTTTQTKINQTIEKIKYLNNQLVVSKNEVNNLRTVSSVVRVDTVFIESKKNFWGKTKIKTNIVSDSTITEISDSSIKITSDTVK